METKRNTANIKSATTPEDIERVRELFREYANEIQVDLCFQGFERELRELPGDYAPPSGRLFLAWARPECAGCIALRRLEPDIGEIKRLYVRPDFRGRGLGRTLAGRVLEAAAEIGYDRLRLDTLSSMTAALALYESLGFRRIEPYYENPCARPVFMELRLT